MIVYQLSFIIDHWYGWISFEEVFASIKRGQRGYTTEEILRGVRWDDP
jgi:hypothetical protein